VIAELRDMNDKVALHTNIADVERKLKKLKSFMYSVPYYDSRNGKIVGIDLYFERSARSTLRKIASTNQLPLF
jgi:hypothetical protein